VALRFLDTVGGTFEELARERSAAAIALGILIVTIKVAAGALALRLTKPGTIPRGRRWLLLCGFGGSTLLIVYSGALVLAGSLVLTDIVTPAEPGRPVHPAMARVRLGRLVFGVGSGSCGRNVAVPHEHFNSTRTTSRSRLNHEGSLRRGHTVDVATRQTGTRRR
jgi:hypothetical protein